MLLPSSTIRRYAIFSFTLSLLLLWSGVGCLAACLKDSYQKAAQSSCEMNQDGSHSCCAINAEDTDAEDFKLESGPSAPRNCCAFAAGKFNPLNEGKNIAKKALAITPLVRASFIPTNLFITRPIFIKTRLTDGRETYLRCRVMRI